MLYVQSHILIFLIGLNVLYVSKRLRSKVNNISKARRGFVNKIKFKKVTSSPGKYPALQ